MKLTRLCATAALPLALLAAPLMQSPALASPADPEATAAAPKVAPALWKVADEDTTIYLFGTIHVLPEGLDWYDARIAHALESADLIVKELGPDAFETSKVQAALLKHGVLPEGPSLRERMSPEQRATYEAELAKMGMDPATLDRFQPWFVATRIVLTRLQAMGIDQSRGVEAVIDTKAPDTPRAGLETVDLQFGAFASLPMEKQLDYLRESFAETDDLKDAFAAMVSAWIAGEADELAAVLNEAMVDSGLEKPLLHDRNANWAVWIENRLEEPGTVFMAVGAGHLAGQQSVQAILREREISVERVR